MNQVYTRYGYNIYRSDDGYIIHDSKRDFKDAHTHISNYKTAVYLINMAKYKRVPHHLPLYLLISLIRISGDDGYTDKITELIDSKKSKGNNQYFNSNKGIRR